MFFIVAFIKLSWVTVYMHLLVQIRNEIAKTAIDNLITTTQPFHSFKRDCTRVDAVRVRLLSPPNMRSVGGRRLRRYTGAQHRTESALRTAQNAYRVPGLRFPSSHTPTTPKTPTEPSGKNRRQKSPPRINARARRERDQPFSRYDAHGSDAVFGPARFGCVIITQAVRDEAREIAYNKVIIIITGKRFVSFSREARFPVWEPRS